MKPITNTIKHVKTTQDNVDTAIDKMLIKVTDRLAKLKNKDYLVDYLVASGLSIDHAKKMVHGTT